MYNNEKLRDWKKKRKKIEGNIIKDTRNIFRLQK